METRTSEQVHSRITDYFHRKGETSLNKWQINSIVRQVMAARVSVTNEDIMKLEDAIRRKETGLPGSKMSPKATSTKMASHFERHPNSRMNGGSNASSPLAMNAQRSLHQKRASMADLVLMEPPIEQRGGDSSLTKGLLSGLNTRSVYNSLQPE